MPISSKQNFTNPIEFLSHAVFLVKTYHNDILLTTGTAFCYCKDNEYFLISNYHIFAGRNPDSSSNGIRQPIHKEGAIPNKIKITIGAFLDDKNKPVFASLPAETTMDLIDAAGNDLFIKYPENIHGFADIAILPISNILFKQNVFIPSNTRLPGGGPPIYNVLSIDSPMPPFCINHDIITKIKSEIVVHPTDNIYILGFPFGDMFGSRPIWKKGSLARSIIDGDGYLLVDTATRSGMSGSPAFYIDSDHIHTLINTVTNEQYISEKAYRIEFLGIYSGRIISGGEAKDGNGTMLIKECDADIAAQLGKVWRKDTIDWMINYKVKNSRVDPLNT